MPRVLERIAAALYIFICLLLSVCVAGCGRDGLDTSPVSQPRDILREIDEAPVPEGIEPELWAELKATLRGVVQAEGRTKVSAAAPTSPLNQIDDFRIRFSFRNDDSDCYWSYLNRGDYDLNGEVNISDLTPIGVHFKKRSISPDWEEAQLADGDGNGEVNIADVTPIGVNIANSITGYMLQSTRTPETEESWSDVDPLPFSDGRIDFDAPMNLSFCYFQGGGNYGTHYRVVPYTGDGPGRQFGIPSNSDMLPTFDQGTHGQNFLAELNDFTSTAPAFDSAGNIYAGSANNYLYSLDPTGTLRWKFLANGNLTRPAIGPGDTVYAGCEDGTLYALDADGNEVWTMLAGGPLAAPAVGPDARIYVGSTDRNLYCLNPDGSIAWTYSAGVALKNEIAFGADGSIFFFIAPSSFNSNLILVALDSAGTFKWQFQPPDEFFGFSSDGTLAVAPSGSLLFSQRGALYSVGPEGNLEWSFSDVPITSQPHPGSDGTIYAAARESTESDAISMLVAIDPAGAELWRYDSLPVRFSNTKPFINSPFVVRDDGIYLTTSHGDFIAIGPDGSLIDEVELGFSRPLYQGPSDQIYGSGAPLYRFDLDGTIVWEYGVPPGTDGVVFANGQVYAGTDEVRAFDTAGNLLWFYDDNFGTSRTTLATGDDGLVYCMDHFGVVCAVRPDGSSEWQSAPLPYIPYRAPAISNDGDVYIVFGLNFGETTEDYFERITALDSSGNQKWVKEYDFYSARTPIIDDDGNIYFSGNESGYQGNYDSTIIALRSNGTEIWQYATPLSTGFSYDSPLLYGDGRIYLVANQFGLPSGALVQLDQDGFELGLTKAPVQLHLGLSFRPDGSIITGGESYACATDNVVSAFDSEGDLLWSQSIRSTLITTPVSGPDGSVYVGAGNGHLYALNPDGSHKWTYRARDGFHHKPAVAPDGTVYALDDAGTLYSIAP